MGVSPYTYCSCHEGAAARADSYYSEEEDGYENSENYFSEKTKRTIPSDQWQPNFVDPREDRVVLSGYVDATPKEFVYRIKAINKGDYTVPPVFSESMYDRTIRALGMAAKIQVRD